MGKRTLDFVLSMLGIFVLLPFLLLITVIIAFAQGGPIIFKQQRPGLKGKPFMLYKFRTMKTVCDDMGNLLPDQQRVTRIGQILRSTSMDELPELWNVLKGEMSLVGPRPLLMQYLQRYSPEQARRHEAKPGITGWAQVNGRNAITWEEKFMLDIWYVEHQSFWLDLRILAMTFWKVLKREGIFEVGNVTMSEFMGSSPSSSME